jgi:MFS family permease
VKVQEASFPAPRDKWEFWIFCAAVFLVFFTNSTTAYLSVLLASSGLSEQRIGEILSFPLLPSVIAILASGRLIERYSALTVAKVGTLISLIAFVALQAAIPDPLGTGVLRVLLSLGVGIFLPAGMVYAKSKLVGPGTASLFGMYAVMLTLPLAAAPPVAEWYFDKLGSGMFFIVLAVPLAVGLAMMSTLTRDLTARPHELDRESYWSLITRGSTAAPNLIILLVGLMWGFVISFMALFLRQSNCPVDSFFSTCMVAVIASRSVVLRFTARWPRELLVAIGLVAMGAAYCAMAMIATTVQAMVLCGGIFGLGYGLTFPVLSVWVSSQFVPERRGRPVALFGAAFQLGVFAIPLLAGEVSRVASLRDVLSSLGIVAGFSGGVLIAVKLARECRRQRRWGPVGKRRTERGEEVLSAKIGGGSDKGYGR